MTNTGSFQNMGSSVYWLGSEYAPDPDYAWVFNAGNGFQDAGYKGYQFHSLAVRPGDVMAAVPEPETYMMLLLGLGAVGAVARRRKAKQA